MLMTCRLLPLWALLCLPVAAMAEAADPLLFESDDMLELTMPVDFEALCRPSEDPDCDFVGTVIQYRDAAGQERSVPVEIRRRDGWRAQRTNCQIPTLFLRFSPEDVANTLFEGQNRLALTSHCGKGLSPKNVRSPTLPDEFEAYVVNEYLGYRLYNLIADVSLMVRIARMTFAHPDGPRRDMTRDAFFAEHFDSLAQRVGAEVIPPADLDPGRLDMQAADDIALFNYMIGNTDWSIEQANNILLLEFPDQRQVPVLYDLDMSGLVDAHYAVPAEGLPIESVKQRYYLGYCHNNDWDALFDKFSRLYQPVMQTLRETPGMGRGDRRLAGVYLDSFFDTLFSEESRASNIVSACRPWPWGANEQASAVN